MKKILYFATLIPSLTLAQSGISHCLAAAYPEISALDNNTIRFKNGATMQVGSISKRKFSEVINNPSLAEQLMQSYPLNFKEPKQYEDAGRIRNDDFFKNMYGSTLAEVNKNMRSVRWQPSGQNIRFNQLNGAAEQLEKVGKKIAQHPELINYLNKSLGSLNFRKIAGTNRLSAHSFGIAVDFQLPKHLHKYWRWDGCTSEDKVCRYPKQLLNDEKLKQIVQIFENHGFIWGGKWASYDSVHFEYRPELLIAQCRNLSFH